MRRESQLCQEGLCSKGKVSEKILLFTCDSARPDEQMPAYCGVRFPEWNLGWSSNRCWDIVKHLLGRYPSYYRISTKLRRNQNEYS